MAFGDAERLGDQFFQRAVGFVVLGRGAHARFQKDMTVGVGAAAIDAVGAARGRQPDP